MCPNCLADYWQRSRAHAISPLMNDHRSEEIAVRRKRLRFRALRRGFKEVDLIFGTFAAENLETMNGHELEEFERLLDAPDQEIYVCLKGEGPAPAMYDTPLFARLKAYCRRTSPTWNV
jgi:antitoxin CptB